MVVGVETGDSGKGGQIDRYASKKAIRQTVNALHPIPSHPIPSIDGKRQ